MKCYPPFLFVIKSRLTSENLRATEIQDQLCNRILSAGERIVITIELPDLSHTLFSMFFVVA